MKFEKVSFEQYKKDCLGDFKYNMVDESTHDMLYDEDLIRDIYDNIKLPSRATKKSAGYDFYAPYSFTLKPQETIKIATGIRVILDDDTFLMCAPRSGHGFKARIQLDNTVGIIDADYSDSDNEGHIMLKLTNDTHTGVTISIDQGAGMMQAIIMKYFTVENDTADTTRNGGFGSTDNK